MKRQASLFLCCFILSGLSACSLPVRSNPGPTDQAVALQYQTVSALLTATAASTSQPVVAPSTPPTDQPNPVSKITATPSPERTEEVVLVISVTQTPVGTTNEISEPVCDLAHPGRPIDITIPDETRLHPGEYFSKTWRLVNAGSCAWDQNYSVVWFSGDDLGLTHTLRFNSEIDPGMPTDVTVDMVAPEAPGTYQSNWKLRNSQGELFGIGPNGSSPFWVRIVVIPVETATITPTQTLPTSTSTPSVVSEGSVILKLDNGFDLDSGTLNLTDEDDLRFQHNPEALPVLAPTVDALLAPFGVGKPGFNDCLVAELKVDPVRLDQFQPGMYFCYRTSLGLPGWFLLSSVDLDQGEAGFDFITWSLP